MWIELVAGSLVKLKSGNPRSTTAKIVFVIQCSSSSRFAVGNRIRQPLNWLVVLCMLGCVGETSDGVTSPSMTSAPGPAFQLAASAFEFGGAATTGDYVKVREDHAESLTANAGSWFTPGYYHRVLGTSTSKDGNKMLRISTVGVSAYCLATDVFVGGDTARAGGFARFRDDEIDRLRQTAGSWIEHGAFYGILSTFAAADGTRYLVVATAKELGEVFAASYFVGGETAAVGYYVRFRDEEVEQLRTARGNWIEKGGLYRVFETGASAEGDKTLTVTTSKR